MDWDVVEPTDRALFEEASHGGPRSGETRLLLAILESAIEDFQNYFPPTGNRSRELFEQAEHWIMENGARSFCSFENVCAHLRLDPAYIRRGLLAWKAAKLHSDDEQTLPGQRHRRA